VFRLINCGLELTADPDAARNIARIGMSDPRRHLSTGRTSRLIGWLPVPALLIRSQV